MSKIGAHVMDYPTITSTQIFIERKRRGEDDGSIDEQQYGRFKMEKDVF